MTTGIILYPTQAGFDRENTALATGAAMPKLAKVVVGDGVPNANPGTATALTNKRGEAQSGSIVRLSPSAISGNAGISPVGAITITEIGIELEDGTLYAYGAMMAPTGFFKGDGVGLDLQFVLSRENLDSIEIAVSLLDLAAMAEQIKNMALAGFAGEASPIVAGMISPLQNAVRLTWEDGIQRFEMELFASGFSLRNTPPITVSGARAGDDSIDVSNATVPLAGDFVLFDAANSEQVRIDESLELGRRLTQTPLLHTYPTSATLSHTNWVISPGEAVCPAGSVYFPRRLRLTEGDVHRVYIRALTAAGAPQLSWRADGGEFAAALLVTQRGIDATWTDYGFDVPAGEYFWLRVLTPENTRVQSIVACNTLHDVRVLTAPMLIGDAAVPGQPVTISMSASSRLAGGSIARFDIVRDGALTSHNATSNAANVAMTFAGEVGETRQFIVTAVDDLGNRSTPTLHTVTLADNITPPAPSITSPTAGATGVGLTPQLSASAFVVAGATHASTDWEVRAADGQTVVWQSLNNTNQLTSITVPANTLSANTGYQAWVRYRTGSGAVTAWGSAGFTTLAVPAALAGEMSWTTPGSYTWTVPDGVTAGSVLVVDGSGGDVVFGPLAVVGNGFEATQRQLPTAQWDSVTYGNGLFVAASTSNNIAATSPDGINWTQRQLPATADWHSVTYGNGMFVVVAGGNNNRVSRSLDGISWYSELMPTTANWFSVTYGNGLFVAVAFSNNNIAATSPDGINWTQRQLPATASWHSITYGNGLFVAVAEGGSIAATSPDGINWTQRQLPTTALWHSITYGNGMFVAVAEGGSIVATSPDGINWTQRQLPTTALWHSITYGNGLFVAVAEGGSIAATSPDGINWTQRQLPVAANWRSVTYGNGLFVAVAYNSSIAAILTAGPTVIHADTTLTSTTGFSLTAPTSAGSYGVSSGVAAYDNDMPLTPGAQITVTVPAPDGAVRVIWGAGRSFPSNAASAGTQIGIVLVAEGGGAGQWQRVDGNFNPVNYPFGGAFFNSHPTYAGIVDQTIDGQAMVKVPKFWFKTGNVPSGQYAGKRYWMISDQAAPGFAVHPAFMNYGVEVAQYWLGKYQGTADGGKLGSQAGPMPLTNLDFPTMQARAVARNVSGVSGFMMWSIYQLAAVQMLCLIEMGSSDSQAVIGAGNVSSNPGVQSVESGVVATATWRGIVGLWGNVWQMVDGLLTDGNSKYEIWDRSGHRTYQSTNLTTPPSGRPITMAMSAGTDYDMAAIFAAEATDLPATTASYGDYFIRNQNSIALHGYAVGSGVEGGLFALSVHVGAQHAGADVGTRLAKY